MPPEKVKLGPLVLMSGFMTKRTRSLNRWKQRWWQLMDDGILYYYKSDDHPKKLLGKIDVGKTCYEVKLGAEICRVKFPQAVPSCCCFCFAVLSRTFYVYTPTPDEAEKWAQAITGLSRVINRKVVAGLERRKAPKIPGISSSASGNMQIRVTRVRTRGSQGGLSDSCQDISKVQFLPLEKNLLASKKALASSVPDYLDRIGLQDISGSGMSLDQDSEIVTMKELQESRNGGHRSSLPFSFMREHPLSGSIKVSQQLQKEQIKELKQCQQKLRIQKGLYHRSHSVEDISPQQTQPRPVPKPRKGKAARNSLPHEEYSTERFALALEKMTNSKTAEVKPAPPSSSPPPSHPPPLFPVKTHKRPPLLRRKNSAPLPFSPPSSPPPPPPQQNDSIRASFLPLSSPPSSRPERNIDDIPDSHLSLSSCSKTEEKPFPPPRPRTEKDTAPISSPPRPRKKTMARPPSAQQDSRMDDHTENVDVITAEPEQRSQSYEHPKFIAPPPPPL